MNPNTNKIHLHAAQKIDYGWRGTEIEIIGCDMIKRFLRYGVSYYNEAEPKLSKKVEQVTCFKCIEKLIKSRSRCRAIHLEVETPAVFDERQRQLQAIVDRTRKKWHKDFAKCMRENQKAKEAAKILAEKRRKEYEEEHSILDRGPLPDLLPLSEFVTTHEYSAEDYTIPSHVLTEAVFRAHGSSVDCDEETLVIRMQRGRNLEVETSWFISAGMKGVPGYRYIDLEEYWDL